MSSEIIIFLKIFDFQNIIYLYMLIYIDLYMFVSTVVFKLFYKYFEILYERNIYLNYVKDNKRN